MAAAVDDFSVWLGKKLQALNTDESVFGSYITGILDGDDTLEDKIDAIEGILSEIVESDISSVCKEIIDKWESMRSLSAVAIEAVQAEDVDDKLVRLLESQTLATTVQREYTAEEKRLREAILAQYGQTTDSEGEEEDDGASDRMQRNTNALAVQLAEKEKREYAKLESQRKKDKDKEDREKQKQMKEEKKEKRKTQKGERKR